MASVSEKIDSLYGDKSTTVAKDLKLNFRRLLDDSTLNQEESTQLTIALAKATGAIALLKAARESASDLGLAPELIQESEESAAIMGMLNIYYRTRHFIEHHDPTAESEYGQAKLRMMALANPAIGKERFEMLAFAVSCINGCEKCVTSHEKALMAAGVARDKIHDLIRLSAVIMGLSRLN